MPGEDEVKPDTEYTIADVQHDLKQIAKVIKVLSKQSEAVDKRLEQLEQKQTQPGNNGSEDDNDDSFGEGDRRRALSILSEYVFNPEDKIMLHQMTNTPNRMVMPVIIEHTVNEFISDHAFNPDSKVLLSDIFMKWFARIMRSKGGDLITQAMGFSQIERMQAVEEEERKLELSE